MSKALSRPNATPPAAKTPVSNFTAPALPRLLCFLLTVITLAAYLRVSRLDFVNYDDPEYVTANSHVARGITGSGLVWAFTTGHAGNWHPLTWLSHMVDVQLFGMKAGWHHVTNLLLHVANTLLLFHCLRRLTGSPLKSALVSGLFALHPLHVESVAWIAERKDLLSTFFGLLALLAYVFYARSISQDQRSPKPVSQGRKGAAYLACLLLFSCSLMSKPMLVSFPFLLLLLDYWPLARVSFQRANRKRSLHLAIRDKVPLLALSIFSSVVTVAVQSHGGAVAKLADLSVWIRLQTALVAYGTYLRRAVIPTGLAVFYPHPGNWNLVPLLGAGLLVLLISVMAVVGARRLPYLFVGWFWFLGTLLPVIGLVQVGAQANADRYTYFPLVGIFIVAVWGLSELFANSKTRNTLLAPLATAAILACGFATWTQLWHWRSSEALFSHALEVTAGNYAAHNNLGVALFERGKTNEALAHYTEAARLKPDSATALTSIGMALLARGQTNEAFGYYSKALAFDPNYAEAHYNLGIIAFARGDVPQAIQHFGMALDRKEDFPDAHYNLGMALDANSDTAAALLHYRKALELDPDDADMHNNLGVALARQGKLEEAIRHFEAALKSRKRFASAQYNLAEALLRQGRLNDAIASFGRALLYQPEWPGALNNFAWLLATHPNPGVRDGPRALSLAQSACKLVGSSEISYMQTLAAAYAECGRFEEATATARSAYELAKTTGQYHWTNVARERVELYSRHQPLRQVVR